MQLLEKLAVAQDDMTITDITMECMSASGYVECIEELIQHNILAESVVMEGAIGSVINIFQKIIKKIIDVLKNAVAFFSKKLIPKKSQSDPKSKDKAEQEEYLKQHPYTGPSPDAIRLYEHLVDRFLITASAALFQRMLNISAVLKTKDENYVEKLKDGGTELFGLMLVDIISNVVGKDTDDEYANRLIKLYEKSLISPDDFAKIPNLLYKFSKQEITDYTNRVFTPQEAQRLRNNYNFCYSNHTDHVAKVRKELEAEKKRAEQFQRIFDSTVAPNWGSQIDDQSKKLIDAASLTMAKLSNCIFHMINGITAMFTQVEKDIHTIDQYIVWL